MRKIDFRGKRIDNGKWVYGYYFVNEFKNEHKIHCKVPIGMSTYFVDSETVGQYTGLKDNKRTKEHPKGQKIYEGDILQWLNAPGMIDATGSVIWYNDRAVYYVENDEENIYDELYNVFDYSEIIGNIHER